MERQCVKMKDSKTTFEHGGLRHITMRREKHNYDRRSYMWAMVYLDLSWYEIENDGKGQYHVVLPTMAQWVEWLWNRRVEY